MNKIVSVILQADITFTEAKILLVLYDNLSSRYSSLKKTVGCTGVGHFAKSIKLLLNKKLIIENGGEYCLNPIVFEKTVDSSKTSKSETTPATVQSVTVRASKADSIFTKRTSVEWDWNNSAGDSKKFILKNATPDMILLDYYKAVKGIKFSKIWNESEEGRTSKTNINNIIKIAWGALIEVQPDAGIDDFVKLIKHIIDYTETNCRRSFPNWQLTTVKSSLMNAMGLYFRGDIVSLEKEEFVDGEEYVKRLLAQRQADAIKKCEEELEKERLAGGTEQIADISAKSQLKTDIIALKDSDKISPEDMEWYDGFREYMNQEQFFKLSLNELWTEYTAKHGFPEYKIIQTKPQTQIETSDKDSQAPESSNKANNKEKKKEGSKKLWD